MKVKYWIAMSLLLAVAGTAVFVSCGKDSQSASTQAEKTLYHCPMHPDYISDRPGDCPICGMKLVPIEKGSDTNSVAVVSGRTAIGLSDERRQLIGVRSEQVVKRRLETVVRASARTAYDPELYSAEAEYREALKIANELKESGSEETQKQGRVLVNSARLKLRGMGLSDAQIDAINPSSPGQENLLFGSNGRLWVYAQIYENEIGMVKPGQDAEVTSRAYPGKIFQGRVLALDPVLDPQTRSLRVRIQVEDPAGVLKPNMYLDASIKAPLEESLVIPRDAVIETGERQIVFIDMGDGMFEPREVVLGKEAEGMVQVLSGLKEGEKVVVAAAFLIDSESRLKASLVDKSKDAGKHSH